MGLDRVARRHLGHGATHALIQQILQTSCKMQRRRERRPLPPTRVHEALKDKGLYVSNVQRKRLSRLYDAYIRSKPHEFVHLDERPWEGRPVWGLRHNIGTANPFYWDFWSNCGALEAPWLKDPREAFAFGGSAWDGLVALKSFDRVYPEPPWDLDDRYTRFLEYLGWKEGFLTPLHPDLYGEFISVKTQANPGPTFKDAGMDNKASAAEVGMSWLRSILAGEITTAEVPPILWGLGGKSRSAPLDKLVERLDKGRPMARAIWMADAHEAVFGWRYQQPLTQWLSMAEERIDVGFDNKGGWKHAHLMSQFNRGGAFVSGDWERFDSSVPPWMVTLAYRVMRHVFGVKEGTPDDDILSFLEYHNIHSSIVCPDRTVRTKHGGVASGTVFTAITDSIINLFIMWVIADEWRKTSFGEIHRVDMIRVMGDDNIQRIDVVHPNTNYRFKVAKSYLDHMARCGLRIFGVVIHADKSKASVSPYVKYSVPKAKEKVPDHSRWHMKTHPWHIKVNGLIRPAQYLERCTMVKDYEVVELSMETGYKRWHYNFSGAASYLSCTWLADGTPVRPTPKILSQLASTSAPVKDVWDWRTLVLQYLVEHWGNIPARMNLLSMYLDSFYMEQQGITRASDAFEDIHNSEVLHCFGPVRKYTQKHWKDRAEEAGFDCRLWWVANANWWPDLTDARFSWVRPNIRAMQEVVHRVWGLSDRQKSFTHDIGRYRLALLQGSGAGIQPGRTAEVHLERLFTAVGTAVDRHHAQIWAQRRVNWDPGPGISWLAFMLRYPDHWRGDLIDPSVWDTTWDLYHGPYEVWVQNAHGMFMRITRPG